MTGSNRRPPACKAGALPAELTARTAQRYERELNAVGRRIRISKRRRRQREAPASSPGWNRRVRRDPCTVTSRTSTPVPKAARPTVVPLHEDLKLVRVKDGASQDQSELPKLQALPLARDVVGSLRGVGHGESLDASTAHGDDVVGNEDGQQQPRNRGRKTPCEPIAQSLTCAQSRPVVPKSVHRHGLSGQEYCPHSDTGVERAGRLKVR